MKAGILRVGVVSEARFGLKLQDTTRLAFYSMEASAIVTHPKAVVSTARCLRPRQTDKGCVACRTILKPLSAA